MSLIKEQQIRDNQENQEKMKLWERFRKVNQVIIETIGVRYDMPKNRALFLGAGNGNDIPLDYIEKNFDEIVLVDIDEAALQRLLTKVENPNKFTIVIADLSGISDQLPNKIRDLTEEELVQLMKNLNYNPEWKNAVQGKFDFIMTCHLTTQLVSPVILRQMNKEIKITQFGTFNVTLNLLVNKVVEELMIVIHSLLTDKGLFLHSTDTYELSYDENNTPLRPGTAEIITAVKGDLTQLHTILPLLTELARNNYAITGSSVPLKAGEELFKLQTTCCNYWHFTDKPYLQKFYIVFGYVFSKKL